MKKSFYVALLCISWMCVGLFSCEKDEAITEVPGPVPEELTPEPEPELAHYVDITYTLNCSEDLLKYMVPQVTYIGDDGQEVTVRIADSEWEVNDDVDFDVAFGDGLLLRAKVLKWTRRIHREEFPVDDEMSVSYLLKADMPEYEKTSVNLFYNDLAVESYFVDEENGLSKSMTVDGDVSYTLDETKEELFTIVDRTEAPYFMGTNGANLVIGADSEVIESVSGVYRRKTTVRVGDDGSYSESTQIDGEE